jgi:hypothetical protein
VDAVLTGAICAAIQSIGSLHAVADNATVAMGAGRRKSMDGAFKAVEHMRLTGEPDFKAFIVAISAHLTGGHPIPERGFGFIHTYLLA